MLSVSNINVYYQNRVLFDNANIKIVEGKLTAIHGVSGGGKTTLLYILGLISSFKDYKYFINGKNVDINNHKMKAEIRKSQIGFVFQDKNLHDYLSIEDNIKLYCLLSGHEYEESRAVSVLQKVHLNLPLNTKCKFMSGGEKQRLAIACALIKDPIMIVADEPTSALDRKNTDIIISLLKEIAEEGKMVVIATHSPYVIGQCDNVYRIENHKLLCNKEIDDNNEPVEIIYRKMKSSFYKWYMKFQFGKSFVERLISLLLPVLVVSIVLSAFSLKDGMVESYTSLLNDYVSNEVLIKSNYIIDNKNYNRLKSIDSVDKGYYCFEEAMSEININGNHVVTDEVFYVVPYYEHQKEYFQIIKEYDGNVYLSYDMNNLINEKEGYTLSIKSDVLKKDMLDIGGVFENDYFLTQSKERYVVYIPYSYFDEKESNKMLLHLEDFYAFEGIEEKIHKVNSGLKISLSQDKYLLQMEQVENYEDMLYKFTLILLILSVGILAIGQIYVIYNQRYELAVLKANGLMNKEVIKMISYQCIRDIVKVLSFVLSILFILKIILNYMNIGFVILTSMHLYIILALIVFDYIFPSLISCAYICYFDAEKILRF